MFNNYSYNPTQKVNINAVSGTISKTCEKSFFKYAQIGSDLMKSLTGNEPSVHTGRGYDKAPVVVLQSMCIGDNYMMFEVMWKKDFEELKEKQNEID